MKRVSILLSLVVVCLITTMQAQTPAPHPSPELQKLHVFVGHWAGEVEFKPGPWGPGSNAVIEETGQMILGGHFLQIQDTWKGSSQQALWIIGYDPTNQNYSATAYFSGGDTLSGTITCDGNVWSFASKKKISLGGAQYSIRLILTPAADRMSRLDRTEVSPDDKTWLPFDAEKWTKVKTASKK